MVILGCVDFAADTGIFDPNALRIRNVTLHQPSETSRSGSRGSGTCRRRDRCRDWDSDSSEGKTICLSRTDSAARG